MALDVSFLTTRWIRVDWLGRNRTGRRSVAPATGRPLRDAETFTAPVPCAAGMARTVVRAASATSDIEIARFTSDPPRVGEAAHRRPNRHPREATGTPRYSTLAAGACR